MKTYRITWNVLKDGQHTQPRTDGRTADPKTQASRRLLFAAEAKNVKNRFMWPKRGALKYFQRVTVDCFVHVCG